MAGRGELLVLGCREDDATVIRSAAGRCGPVLHAFDSATEFTGYLVRHRPLAVFVGIGLDSLPVLDVIPVVRAVVGEMPVIVIAEEDSLELERSARRRGIFYYLVHPVERAEVKAVLKDVRRCVGE